MPGNGKNAVSGVTSGATSSRKTTAIPRYQGMYSTGTRNMSGPNSLATLKIASTTANTQSFGNLHEVNSPGTNSMTSSTSRLGTNPNSLPNSTSRLGTKTITSSTSKLGTAKTKAVSAASSKNVPVKASGMSVTSSGVNRNRIMPHPSTSRFGSSIRKTSDSGLNTNKSNDSKSTAPKIGARSGLYAPRMTKTKRETKVSFPPGSSRRTSQTSLAGTSGQMGAAIPMDSSNTSTVSTDSNISLRPPNSGLGNNVPNNSSGSSLVSTISTRSGTNKFSENISLPEDRNAGFVLPPLSPRSNDRPSSSHAARSANGRLNQPFSASRPTSSSMQESRPIRSPVPGVTNQRMYSRQSSRTPPSDTLVSTQYSQTVQRVPSLEDVHLATSLSANSQSSPGHRSFESSLARLTGTSRVETRTSSGLVPVRLPGVIRSTHTAATRLPSPPESQADLNPPRLSSPIRRASTPVLLSALLTPPPSLERHLSSDAQTAPRVETTNADARSSNPGMNNNELINITRPGHAPTPVSVLSTSSSHTELTASPSPLSQLPSATPTQDEAYAQSLMEEEMASIEQEDERLAQRLSTALSTETSSDVEETSNVPTLRRLSSRQDNPSILENRRFRSQLFLRDLLSLMQNVEEDLGTSGASGGATTVPTTPIQGLLHMLSRGSESSEPTSTESEANSSIWAPNRSSTLEDYMRSPMLLLLFLLQNHSRESNANQAIESNDYESLWDLAEQLGEVKKKGLTEEEILQIPSREFIGSGDELGEQCRVCLTDYEEDERLRILPCQHEFHLNCIDQWLQRNATCPICRNSMGKS